MDNSGPKKSIKTKNKLYVKYIKHKTFFNEKTYKDYKRISNYKMKKAERDHYGVLFRVNKDNLKKTWAINKEVINKTKTKTTVNIFLNKNKVITNTALKISSPGLDGIHAKVIKDTFPLYIEQLVHILNLSILQGVFPSVFKTACVIPIYKGDNNMIICNYRPVSVLRVFSKIFERILYSRLFNFITKQNILYTFYRKT